MSQTHPVQGRCLCGAVTVRGEAKHAHVDACHCSMCRNWGGGPLICVECGDSVTLEGKQHVTVFDSSDWAERGFCSHCGTHLFYRLKDGGLYAVPVGVLEPGTTWEFTKEIFIDQKPDYYSFANPTQKMTGEEVFAQFSGGN